MFSSLVPGNPSIVLLGKSPNSLSFSWDATEMTTYSVRWQKTGCLAKNGDNNGCTNTNHTSYNITGLEEGSRYIITVSAGEHSNTVTAVTEAKSETIQCVQYYWSKLCGCFSSSFCSS